jgi:hypothetical protein
VCRSQLAGEAKSSTFASKLAPTEGFKTNFNSLLVPTAFIEILKEQ